MTVATIVAGSALALTTLSACGSDDSNQPSAPLTQSTQPSETPTTAAPTDPTTAPTGAASPSTAKDLVGDWSDKAANWTVHFKSDSSYTMDYQGVDDFTSGKYQIGGGTVKLVGGDGDTSTGTVKGQGIVFKLGTLTRDAAK